MGKCVIIRIYTEIKVFIFVNVYKTSPNLRGAKKKGLFMKRFSGFTLTELMVALAVIGVLVAIVTPAVVKTRPNKNKMMVKKTYYTTEQIVNSLINDEVLYPDMREACSMGIDDNSSTYCAWGFDYVYQASFEGNTYEGANKFGALFKDRLNVRANTGSSDGNAPDNVTYYPEFYTTDGAKWNLSGTKGAWTARQSGPGTFDSTTAGIGTITIDVNGDDAPNQECTAANTDCDQYQIQILANGKMRVNPNHSRAVEWITINTSVRDAL
jgi:prepilin-type N-terminal cleavage/methylation domain-containing protein